MPWRCCRARSPRLFFYLRRRTAFRRQGDVGERRVGRGSMPMFLFRGNVHDIAGDNDLLLRFCGDDALAGGHEQHLITAVSVHFVTRPSTEVDDAQIEVVARLWREQRLPRHRTAGEQGSVHGLSRDLAGLVYFHSSILLSRYGAFLVSRFCASRASQASAMASTTFAHSSTGTSIMRPSRGTAAVPAATAPAKASRTLLLNATSSAVGVKAALTGATQPGSGQRTPFIPRFLASVAIR